MSIGKDITNRKTKFRPEQYSEQFEEEQEKQAIVEEGKLERGTQKAKSRKELTVTIPGELPHEVKIGEETEFDKEKPNVNVDVSVVGGKRGRKKTKIQ